MCPRIADLLSLLHVGGRLVLPLQAHNAHFPYWLTLMPAGTYWGDRKWRPVVQERPSNECLTSHMRRNERPATPTNRPRVAIAASNETHRTKPPIPAIRRLRLLSSGQATHQRTCPCPLGTRTGCQSTAAFR
jgi:hypothetical protein